MIPNPAIAECPPPVAMLAPRLAPEPDDDDDDKDKDKGKGGGGGGNIDPEVDEGYVDDEDDDDDAEDDEDDEDPMWACAGRLYRPCHELVYGRRACLTRFP
jgi:hypothetical protein